MNSTGEKDGNGNGAGGNASRGEVRNYPALTEAVCVMQSVATDEMYVIEMSQKHEQPKIGNRNNKKVESKDE